MAEYKEKRVGRSDGKATHTFSFYFFGFCVPVLTSKKIERAFHCSYNISERNLHSSNVKKSICFSGTSFATGGRGSTISINHLNSIYYSKKINFFLTVHGCGKNAQLGNIIRGPLCNAAHSLGFFRTVAPITEPNCTNQK